MHHWSCGDITQGVISLSYLKTQYSFLSGLKRKFQRKNTCLAHTVLWVQSPVGKRGSCSQHGRFITHCSSSHSQSAPSVCKEEWMHDTPPLHPKIQRVSLWGVVWRGPASSSRSWRTDSDLVIHQKYVQSLDAQSGHQALWKKMGWYLHGFCGEVSALQE